MLQRGFSLLTFQNYIRTFKNTLNTLQKAFKKRNWMKNYFTKKRILLLLLLFLLLLIWVELGVGILGSPWAGN